MFVRRRPGAAVRARSRPGRLRRAESYLDGEAILDAAGAVRRTRCIPGYGFLCENAEFAQRCLDAGLVFVGPRPGAMRAMASKIEAKRIAQAAGRPGAAVGRGDFGDGARALGYPLLVKAAAGGGGRGMRRVESQRGPGRGDRSGSARGARGVRRRQRFRRTVLGWRAARRGAGARRLLGQRGAPVRARVLDPAATPEADRGGARAVPRAGGARAHVRGGAGAGTGDRLHERGDGRVPGSRRRDRLSSR